MKNTLEKQDFETSQIPNELILDSNLSTKALRVWMLIYLRGSLQESTKFPITTLEFFIYLASRGKTDFRIIN